VWVAVSCSMFQCVVACCDVGVIDCGHAYAIADQVCGLQHVALSCSVLQCVCS